MDTKQHENVLFLTYLSKQKKDKLTSKNFDYQYYLDTISSFSNVEFHSTINRELLTSASRFQILIILAHQEEGLIELESGYLPMTDLVDMIPTTLSVVDIAICGSSIIHDELKKRSQERKVQTALLTTQIEFLLPLYSVLLKQGINKDCYFNLFNQISKLMEAEQKRTTPDKQKKKLGETTKLGANSVFKKASIGTLTLAERNTPFLITIIIHRYRDKDTIMAQIGGSQEGATIKREKDNIKIKDGDKINVSLSFDSDEANNLKGEGKELRIWNDDCGEAEVSFSVTVLPKFTLNAFNAIIDLDVNGVPYITNWKINIKVLYSEFSEIKKVDYGRRILPDNPIKEDPISPRTIEKTVIYVDEPNFEEMQEFEPIDNEYKPLKEKNMQLDMSKTYKLFFDKDGIIEGTHVKIKGIDLPFFEKMVTHAWFEPLYREGLKTNIRCLIRNLSQHFPKMWLDELLKYDYMKGVTRKTIQSATEPTLKAIKNEKRKDFGISTKPKEA